ncbi:hypothetical protein AB0G06_13915 [Nonomuraea dietziae]|uniref:hypothetical protein n=1 Tax=Nonomuraea dietziae TaxID=65515 RepID=UPI0033CB733B
MRLLSLDFDPVYEDATRSTFGSDISVFDYDVVIWDPASSFRSYLDGTYTKHYQGLPALSEHVSVRIQADAKRRRAEFEEFINAGRVLVVLACPPQNCYVDTGRRDHSGTGRNRLTTTLVSSFDLLSALPAECKFLRASGNRIEFDGDGPMVSLLRKYKNSLTYDATITDPPGTILAHVVGTNRVVSSIHQSKTDGYLILLPAINLHDDSDEDSDGEDIGWIPEAPQFQTDLLAAIELLSGSKSISRPAWAEQYATAEQERLRAEIVKQQSRIESGRAKLAKLQQQREIAEAKDQLFLGTGRALELEVKNVLELLGGTVSEPLPGRDDWKVAFLEGDAVVEVKGVAKSAAEKHAAQLEKWVAAAYEETGKAPKGILVVNTWRTLPLTERTEEDFPQQMLPYCNSRGHCLVTGLQFFLIRADVEENPGRAEYWRKLLLETSGMMPECDDWQSVIQLSKPETDA